MLKDAQTVNFMDIYPAIFIKSFVFMKIAGV
jgi:hypothetical protein